MVTTVAPVVTLDQATLSAGVAGESRADLVPNEVVTVTLGATSAYASTSDTGRYAVRFLSVEPTSDTAPAITTATNRTFTFTPPASSYGRTYRIECTVDGGTEYERTIIRTASVRTQNQGFRLQAPGERASASATLQNMGSDQVSAGETNAGASPWGWHVDATAAMRALDTLVGWMHIGAAISSSTPAIFSYVQLDPGTWTFDAIAAKSASGVSFTTEIYDVTGAAVAGTATYSAAATAAALASAAASFAVTATGLYAVRAAASTGTGTLHSIRLRKA